MTACVHESEPLILRLSILRRRGGGQGGPSRTKEASEALVKEYAWGSRTMRSRVSQRKAWINFCDEDRRNPLPVTEGHMVALIRWLTLARERGDRCVNSRSVAQYLSEVSRMHLTLAGTVIPSFLYLNIVLRAYRK